jgi:hypothetical protein
MWLHPWAHLFDLHVVQCMGVVERRMVHPNELLKDAEATCPEEVIVGQCLVGLNSRHTYDIPASQYCKNGRAEAVVLLCQ